MQLGRRFENLLLLRFFAVRNQQSEIRNYQMSRQYTLQRTPRSTSVHTDLNQIDSILDMIGILSPVASN